MKRLIEQLEARMARVTTSLDAAYADVRSSLGASWSFALAPVMRNAAVNAKPGFVAVRTATDVHARRPQEPSP